MRAPKALHRCWKCGYGIKNWKWIRVVRGRIRFYHNERDRNCLPRRRQIGDGYAMDVRG